MRVMLIWDESKRIANLAKHGLDFGSLNPEFFDGSIILPAKLGRYRAIGRLDGKRIVAVVFRPLGGEALSIISMRPASRKEREHAPQDA
jgi:uncharacterized DUF497 family protein